MKHKPPKVLKAILRASNAPKDYIDARDKLRCDACEVTADAKQTSKSSGPKPYVFNHEVGIDVLELHDYQGQCHMLLNIVDQGTNFQIVWYLRPGYGQPSSSECLKAFQQAWTNWAGWPDGCNRSRVTQSWNIRKDPGFPWN